MYLDASSKKTPPPPPLPIHRQLSEHHDPLCQRRWPCSSLLVPAVVLWLLVLVLKLAAKNGSRNGTNDAVTAHLVATKVAGCTATNGAHQSTVAFSLRAGIRGAVLAWLGLSVGALALGILVLRVGALLWELVRRLWTRVLALWWVWLLLAVSNMES